MKIVSVRIDNEGNHLLRKPPVSSGEEITVTKEQWWDVYSQMKDQGINNEVYEITLS